MAKILIVEDEPNMVSGLRDNFQFEGYEVLTAVDGVAGLQTALNESPDIVLLDVMMPRMSGLEVCKQLKSKKPSIPVIMLTARGQEVDKVVGLELGADDYVTKPFSIRELLARVKGLLRRASPEPHTRASEHAHAIAPVEGHAVMVCQPALLGCDNKRLPWETYQVRRERREREKREEGEIFQIPAS